MLLSSPSATKSVPKINFFFFFFQTFPHSFFQQQQQQQQQARKNAPELVNDFEAKIRGFHDNPSQAREDAQSGQPLTADRPVKRAAPPPRRGRKGAKTAKPKAAKGKVWSDCVVVW
jgi:hypothetical protein